MASLVVCQLIFFGFLERQYLQVMTVLTLFKTLKLMFPSCFIVWLEAPVYC